LRCRSLENQFAPDFIEYDRADDKQRIPPDFLAETVDNTLVAWMLLSSLVKMSVSSE